MEHIISYRDERLCENISKLWSDFYIDDLQEEDYTEYLGSTGLASLIAGQSDMVIQILNMKKFRSVYVSPNVERFIGYTPQEINNKGVWQWLRNLNLRELPFQLKNAQLVNQQLKKLNEPNPFMLSFLVNSEMKTKNGEKLRIISTNFTLDWDDKGRQKFHLFMWRNGSHLFKTEKMYTKHIFGKNSNTRAWAYHCDKEKFMNANLLSDREKEVLKLLSVGKISKEIGDLLGISSLTVDNHRKNMINRFQVKNTDTLLEVAKWIREL